MLLREKKNLNTTKYRISNIVNRVSVHAGELKCEECGAKDGILHSEKKELGITITFGCLWFFFSFSNCLFYCCCLFSNEHLFSVILLPLILILSLWAPNCDNKSRKSTFPESIPISTKSMMKTFLWSFFFLFSLYCSATRFYIQIYSHFLLSLAGIPFIFSFFFYINNLVTNRPVSYHLQCAIMTEIRK